jgi:hypothetical protein
MVHVDGEGCSVYSIDRDKSLRVRSMSRGCILERKMYMLHGSPQASPCQIRSILSPCLAIYQSFGERVWYTVVQARSVAWDFHAVNPKAILLPAPSSRTVRASARCHARNGDVGGHCQNGGLSLRCCAEGDRGSRGECMVRHTYFTLMLRVLDESEMALGF